MREIVDIILIAIALAGIDEARGGWASQYETDRLMHDTIEAQQRWDHLPDVLPKTDGYVAVADCSRLGEITFLYRRGIGIESFLVVDCSGHIETSRWMEENNILVEVDHSTAVRWDVVGQGGVHIIELRSSDGTKEVWLHKQEEGSKERVKIGGPRETS